MRTGKVEANLGILNEEFKLPYISDLMTLKIEGKEKQILEDEDFAFYEGEYNRLVSVLEAAHQKSRLQEHTPAAGMLHELLIRIRLNPAG